MAGCLEIPRRGAGEMAQWLRALSALSKDQGLAPTPTLWLTAIQSVVPEIQGSLLISMDIGHTHVAHEYLQAKYSEKLERWLSG